MRQNEKLSQTIVIRFKERHYEAVLEAAQRALIPPSRWIRETIISRLQKEKTEDE